VTHVDVASSTACFAVSQDHAILGDLEVSLGVLAIATEHKLVNEGVEQLAEVVCLMSAIDNVSLSLVIECCLSP